MSALCSSCVHPHLEEQDRAMQGSRDWSDTLVTVEKTPLKRQFLNMGKIKLPDLILKCDMVQSDEAAKIPSASPDTLLLNWAESPVTVRFECRTIRNIDINR